MRDIKNHADTGDGVTITPWDTTQNTNTTSLIDAHGDPADRIITATAIVCKIPLLAADTRIAEWAQQSGSRQVIAV